VPASSQSMTGSAYSRMEAVKMTNVYHPETYPKGQIGGISLQVSREYYLSQKIIHKWPLVHMIQSAPSVENDLDHVSCALVLVLVVKANETKKSGAGGS
jgi:hypothetical protein